MSNPYYDKGSEVLKNKLNITNAGELKEAEDAITTFRLAELQAKPIDGDLDYRHLKDIHRHIFQDIYEWAGKERTIQTEKNGFRFEWPSKIEVAANNLFTELKGENHLANLSRSAFLERAAHYFGELNVVHPFPEETVGRNVSYLTILEENLGIDLPGAKLVMRKF